jgi:hypothetical protein
LEFDSDYQTKSLIFRIVAGVLSTMGFLIFFSTVFFAPWALSVLPRPFWIRYFSYFGMFYFAIGMGMVALCGRFWFFNLADNAKQITRLISRHIIFFIFFVCIGGLLLIEFINKSSWWIDSIAFALSLIVFSITDWFLTTKIYSRFPSSRVVFRCLISILFFVYLAVVVFNYDFFKNSLLGFIGLLFFPSMWASSFLGPKFGRN